MTDTGQRHASHPKPRVRFQRPTLPSLMHAQAHWQYAEADHWFSNFGPLVVRFADELSRFVQSEVVAIPVSNATMGLVLSLRAACGEQPRGSVIVPSYTFAATAAAVTWAGYRPVFVDVDADHWHADPASVRSALEVVRDVAAFMPCSTYGSAPPPALIREWEQIASEASIPLIIDSAAGFGSADKTGQRLGGNGTAEVFSFHATKPFAIGEGGAVITRESHIAGAVRQLANFGFDADRVVHGAPGLNAKMDELHAALGLAVLEDYEDVLKRRRLYADALVECFAPSGYDFQAEAAFASRQFLPARCPSAASRNALLDRAMANNIELRTYFSDPLHSMPAFAGPDATPVPLPVTDDLAARVVCLPIYSNMDAGTLERIAGLAS